MDNFYSQCFDAIPCYLTVQNRDFQIIKANKKFRDDFGNFESRRCYEVFAQRSKKCDYCPVENTFKDGMCHQNEGQVTNAAGDEIAVIVYTTPIYDSNNDITAVMKLLTDITGLKRIQEQLKESEERYHLLFEEVPCYISIQNRDLDIIEANRCFREDFGDWKGRKCYEVYKHRTKECIPCPVKQTFQDVKMHQSEEVVTSIDKKNMNVLLSTAPILDSSGEVQAVMEMSTNITQIRELQSQLSSVGLMVGSISHGIRGELSGLDGGKYLLKTGLKQNDMHRIQQGWEMIQRNFEQIRSLVLNILYYAKDRELKWENLSVAAIAEEALNAVETKGRSQEIEIRKDIEKNTGEFEGDRQAVRSLLINLLDNAIDACRIDKSKPFHLVKFIVRGYPDYVEFEIEDNGVGMEQEEQEKAFSLFFSSKGSEGTGLGLFVANKIVQSHGGRMQLKSEINKGTAFIVVINRKRTETD